MILSYTILDQIISYKKNWVSNQKKRIPVHTLMAQAQVSKRNFYKALSCNNNKTFFILEYKCASPSKGIICKNPNPIKIAQIYKNHASVISIVTDEKYFHGNFNILSQISNSVTQPILCKDFFISTWQIYFARLHKADAILLMLSVLSDQTYYKLSHIAHSLHMGVLTEITNKSELKRAISLNAKVIGINNRNLHDLTIDLNRTINLSPDIPKSIIKISESGITHYHHIRKLSHYVNGFLIGTTLMSQKQLNIAINKLILGENKVCGLTRSEDAYISYKSGAIYGGLIFIANSPRCVNIIAAQHIIHSSAKYLNYIGVFQNAKINHIIHIVKSLNLYAVQLHGSENQDYINKLRKKLPLTCQIWKSIDMKQQPLSTYNPLNLSSVNLYLLDNGGGTGKPFNWKYLTNMQLNRTILAGGLTIQNCSKAAQLGCLGLDFNSGIENQPGIKNHHKIMKIFQILRNY